MDDVNAAELTENGKTLVEDNSTQEGFQTPSETDDNTDRVGTITIKQELPTIETS